jgi:hypothetical protein
MLAGYLVLTQVNLREILQVTIWLHLVYYVASDHRDTVDRASYNLLRFIIISFHFPARPCLACSWALRPPAPIIKPLTSLVPEDLSGLEAATSVIRSPAVTTYYERENKVTTGRIQSI